MLKKLACIVVFLAAPGLAEASIVDPRKVTLRALTERAGAVVIAEARAGSKGLELAAIETVSGSLNGARSFVLAGSSLADKLRVQERGLLFVKADGGGLFDSERAWVAGDAGARAFVESYLSLRKEGPERVTGLLLANLDSSSPRVRQDVLWDLCSFLPQVKALSGDKADQLAQAARQVWGDPESGAAPMILLGSLPAGRGLKDLQEAARSGIKPRIVGRVLAAHGGALDALCRRLLEPETEAAEKTRLIKVLGASARPRVASALLALLGDAAHQEDCLRALANIRGDRRAVPALKSLILSGAGDRELQAWAAVGLAFRADDVSLGALGFARYNHPDPAMRRFITGLLKEPARTRRALERSGWRSFAKARRP